MDIRAALNCDLLRGTRGTLGTLGTRSTSAGTCFGSAGTRSGSVGTRYALLGTRLVDRGDSRDSLQVSEDLFLISEDSFWVSQEIHFYRALRLLGLVPGQQGLVWKGEAGRAGRSTAQDASRLRLAGERHRLGDGGAHSVRLRMLTP